MNMKHLATTLMLMMLMIPSAALAMDHSKMSDDKSMDHSKMSNDKAMDHSKMSNDKAMDHGKMSNDKAMDHGKMDMGGMDHSMDGMMMLGNEEVDGVKAMFHLSDVKAEMAKAGQPFTHHLMVNFVDSKTGKVIDSGKVAVKVKDPAGKEGEAQMMMGMDGHFGVDLTLDQSGTYHFKIGTKLPDGKKREFHPHQDL